LQPLSLSQSQAESEEDAEEAEEARTYVVCGSYVRAFRTATGWYNGLVTKRRRVVILAASLATGWIWESVLRELFTLTHPTEINPRGLVVVAELGYASAIFALVILIYVVERNNPLREPPPPVSSYSGREIEGPAEGLEGRDGEAIREGSEPIEGYIP